jgi:putative tricarboxylic transport membrane protein
MDIIHHLANGFVIAFTPINILYCFIGVFIGTLVGVLPGIGATVSIAILAPITVGLGPTTAIIMLAGIYYGAMYGGSTTAILINIPGEAASVATSLDGYQMARQGKAGPALGISAISSFVAGTLSLILLMTLAVPLASYALAFGPPEYFSLMFLGLTIVVSLVGKSMAKGLLSGLFGMLVATIGMEPITGQSRFTFNSVDLMAGIDFVAVVVGLFAIPEVLENMEGAESGSVEDQAEEPLSLPGGSEADDRGHAPQFHHRLFSSGCFPVPAGPWRPSWPTTWNRMSPSTLKRSAKAPSREWPPPRGPTMRP